MHEDGFLAGRYHRRFQEAASWCCLTGSAQTSIVWSDLTLLGRSPAGHRSIERTNNYLCRRHDVTNADRRSAGASAGRGRSGANTAINKALNWAAEFFVDALLREEQILGRDTQRESSPLQ